MRVLAGLPTAPSPPAHPSAGGGGARGWGRSLGRRLVDQAEALDDDHRLVLEAKSTRIAECWAHDIEPEALVSRTPLGDRPESLALVDGGSRSASPRRMTAISVISTTATGWLEESTSRLLSPAEGRGEPSSSYWMSRDEVAVFSPRRTLATSLSRSGPGSPISKGSSGSRPCPEAKACDGLRAGESGGANRQVQPVDVARLREAPRRSSEPAGRGASLERAADPAAGVGRVVARTRSLEPVWCAATVEPDDPTGTGAGQRAASDRHTGAPALKQGRGAAGPFVRARSGDSRQSQDGHEDGERDRTISRHRRRRSRWTLLRRC